MCAHMARPRERRRSREEAALLAQLHDIAAGLAVAIGLLKGSGEAGHSGRDRYRDSSIGLFESSLTTLRALSASQSPMRIRSLDIESALRNEANRLGIELAFERFGDLGWLTEDELELILLAAREGIRNVARHSGSARCQVIVDVSECPVSLRVRDWGAGIEKVAHATGGVETLRRLAQTMRWTLEIRSLPGFGTELHLVGRGCPRAAADSDQDPALRSVVAKESLGSRKRVARRRPIDASGGQIT